MKRAISMKSSLFLLSLGLLVSSSVKAARRTRASFERSSLYTCDFDSAPCLTMMVSPGGRPYSATPPPWRPALHFMVSRVLFADPRALLTKVRVTVLGQACRLEKTEPSHV